MVTAAQSNSYFNVYVDGIFDIPHAGHLNMMKQAFAKGLERDSNPQLIVGVCDEGVKEYKRATIMSAVERGQSVVKLIDGQFRAVVLHEGVPIKVNAAFIKEYEIKLVVRGDDFDPVKQEEYYGEAMRAAAFVTVPYTPGVSTSQILKAAKIEGSIALFSLKHLSVPEEEIVQRIQSTSWEALNLTPPKDVEKST